MLKLLLLAWLALPMAAWAAPARRVMAERGGAPLEYVDRGTGPAIVMVASLGRGAADFDEIADWLSDQGFRVICPEARGIGRSAPPPAEATLHDYAADVAAIIGYAGAGPAVILGHAYGNTVARTVAADNPALVRGVILVAASGRAGMSEAIQHAIERSSDLTIPDAERLHYLASGYFAPGHDPSVWLGGWYPVTQAAQNKAFRATKLDDYIAAGGHAPILEIQGIDDAIIPHQFSKDLQHELGRRVTLVVIPDAGHAMLPEQPAAVEAAIEAWMGVLDAASPSIAK